MDKKSLSERDICTKFITPAILKAGWDSQKQLLEEVGFTDGKIIVRGRLTARGARKRADYILYWKNRSYRPPFTVFVRPCLSGC
jgi:type I restriction enzyme R subunit